MNKFSFLLITLSFLSCKEILHAPIFEMRTPVPLATPTAESIIELIPVAPTPTKVVSKEVKPVSFSDAGGLLYKPSSDTRPGTPVILVPGAYGNCDKIGLSGSAGVFYSEYSGGFGNDDKDGPRLHCRYNAQLKEILAIIGKAPHFVEIKGQKVKLSKGIKSRND
jgi:hypothetical protein